MINRFYKELLINQVTHVFKKRTITMTKFFKYILIVAFLISAVFKLADFENTILLITKIMALSYSGAKAGLIILIIVELFISLVFFREWYAHKIFFHFIMSVFVFFIIINITFINNGVENCGCLGASVTSSPWIGLLKNIVMASLFAFITVKKKKNHNG